MLNHVEVCVLMDRNQEKGTPSGKLCVYEFDFILICSDRFNNEIHRELLDFGVEEKRIIPAGYGVIFLKYLEHFDGGVDSAIAMLCVILLFIKDVAPFGLVGVWQLSFNRFGYILLPFSSPSVRYLLYSYTLLLCGFCEQYCFFY